MLSDAGGVSLVAPLLVTVSMHLLVLSAFRQEVMRGLGVRLWVSMHLLVLSAFRPEERIVPRVFHCGLNAPFGAQCFPT